MDGFRIDLAVAHHAVGALVLHIGRHNGTSRTIGQTAAHSAENRHLRNTDNGLCNAGLRRKGIYRNHRIGIDIFNDGYISGKHQRLDPAAKYANPAAFTDALGHG